jgi:hypothetical protein
VLAARRRLLGMLLVLALGSAALAVTKMAAWWVIVPPFVMLTGYLALLREASKSDAERRELARTRAAEAAPRRAASPATAATAGAATPGAAPAGAATAGAASVGTTADRAAPAGAAPAGAAPAAGAAAAAGSAAGAVPSAPVTRPVPPVPDAEVIDISASLGAGGEEFYDQYADAKLRAVGDLVIPRPRPAPSDLPGVTAAVWLSAQRPGTG